MWEVDCEGEIKSFLMGEVERIPGEETVRRPEGGKGGIGMKTKIHPALSLLALIGFVSTTVPVHAGTNVNVNLGIPVPVVVAPQPVYIEQPPEMVFIPQSNVYFAFAPGVSVDIFFYDNRWWNRRGDRWYRGNSYNGPWVAVGPRYVPVPVYRMPVDYRTFYVHEKHIPYGQWKKNHGEHGRHGNQHGHHDD